MLETRNLTFVCSDAAMSAYKAANPNIAVARYIPPPMWVAPKFSEPWCGYDGRMPSIKTEAGIDP